MEEPGVEQETVKPTDMDEIQDAHFYLSKSEIIGNIKVQTEAVKEARLMTQDPEMKPEGVLDNHIDRYGRNNPEKVVETEIKTSVNEDSYLSQWVSGRFMEADIDQVAIGIRIESNLSEPTATRKRQISYCHLQLKSLKQDPEPQVDRILYIDPEPQVDQILYQDPEPQVDRILYQDPEPQVDQILYRDPEPQVDRILYKDPEPQVDQILYQDPKPQVDQILYRDPEPPVDRILYKDPEPQVDRILYQDPEPQVDQILYQDPEPQVDRILYRDPEPQVDQILYRDPEPQVDRILYQDPELQFDRILYRDPEPQVDRILYQDPEPQVDQILYQDPEPQVDQILYQDPEPQVGQILYRDPEPQVDQILYQDPEPQVDRILYQDPEPQVVRILYQDPELQVDRILYQDPEPQVDRILYQDPEPQVDRILYQDPERQVDRILYQDPEPQVDQILYQDPEPQVDQILYQDPEPQVDQILYQDPEPQVDQILYQDQEPQVDQILYQDPEPGDEQVPYVPDEERQGESIPPEDQKPQLRITAQAADKENPEQDLETSESFGLSTKGIPSKNTTANLSIVTNIDNDTRKANTKAFEDKPSGTTSERGIQVSDTILRNQGTGAGGTQDAVSLSGERKPKTSVEGIQSVKTSSKSSSKTHPKQRFSCQMLHKTFYSPKVSAQRDLLNKSTRGWKWWRISREKKHIVMEHIAPGEQTPAQSSQTSQTAKNLQYMSLETMTFKEIFPDVNLKSGLVGAFQDAFEFFRKDKTEQVDMKDLQYSLSTMGIHLTRHDISEALKSADIDGDGKVNFGDFLAVLTDDQRFSITIDRRWLLPVFEQEYLGTVLFHAISRLLQKCRLLRKSAAEISKYYQEKYKALPQPPKLQGSQSKVMVDYARGARIMGMTDRQLVHYLEEIRARKGSCVGSPYAVIPCVPLCTGMAKKPRLMPKNIYKGHKESSNPDMEKKVRGMKNRAIQVDIEKKHFTKRATRRKRSSLPHKIQGDHTKRETRNPKFFNIFSTSSWSSNRPFSKTEEQSVGDESELEKSDAECAGVLNKSSWNLPEEKDVLQE